ncbi:MAG: hypothetical protein ACI9JT_001312, partial [Polaribacter sp.]
ADGTAFMWESRSPPFLSLIQSSFYKPHIERYEVFL